MTLSIASVGAVFAMLTIAIAATRPWRGVSWSPRTRSGGRDRILLLGLSPLSEALAREIQARPWSRITLVGVVDDRASAEHRALGYPVLRPFRRLPDIVSALRPGRIVVGLAERRGRTPLRALLHSCLPHGVLVEDAAEFYERLTGKLAIETLTPTSIVFSNRFRPSRIHRAFARALSLAVAIVGLVAFAPLMAIIAAAIKIESPGPVLFRQHRAGLHRRPFTLMKFRTMRLADAPRSEWAGDNGDRVTRVGRWLRASRLDELPQFVNVLRGEMNLVGPRPHPVSNLDLFTLVARNLNQLSGISIGYYELRSLVPPGLTGWAQVRYGYANNLEQEIEKLRFDLYYVKHASPWMDLRILADTVRVLLCGRLADGLPRAEARRGVAAVQPMMKVQR